MEHLHENPLAINFSSAPAESLEFNTASSKTKIYGGRMNQMQMMVVDKYERLFKQPYKN